MRKWKTVFWTIIFVCVSPAVMHGEQPESEEQNSNQRHSGIVSGLVNTITNTVSNTGEAVKQTVEATDRTIKQTADYAEETVKTIAEPSAEKPVTKTVERTADFVRETVQTVQPAVSKTTDTVKQTMKDTAEVSKTLPEIPAVTPVTEETVHAVSETVETTVPVVETTTKAVESVTTEVTKAVKELPVASNALPVVEETVSLTTSTVNRTADTVNKTVQNVTTPTEQPIRQIVKDTAVFIGATVNSTVPVVEKTTDMVKGTVQEVSQTTEILPKIPIVTPVIEEVTELVNGSVDTAKEVTDQTVTDTVGKVNEVLRPAAQPPQITPLEKPVINKPDTSKDKVNPAENTVQLPMVLLQKSAVHSNEDTEKLVNETPEKLVKEEPSEKADNESLLKRREAFELFTEQQERAPVVTDSSFGADQPEMNTENRQDKLTGQMIPPVKENHKAVAESPAVFITSGSSSVISTANGSHIDVSVGLWSEQLQTIRTISKRWYLEHILGKVQWTHPPPGQPPKTTPFLYVSN